MKSLKRETVILAAILILSGILAREADGEGKEGPRIAQLITQQAQEAVTAGVAEDTGPVTVHKKLYLIFVLNNYIDPATCEVVPNSKPTKVYVDTKHYPVSDIGIARKIEVIDYVQQLQKGELQKDQLIKKIETLQKAQRKIPDFDVRDASLDATIKLVSLINVPKTIIKGILKLIKGLAGKAFRETLFSTMQKLRDRTFEDFSQAINGYINILKEIGESKSIKVEGYDRAKRIFDEYQLAKNKEKTALLLAEKIYDKTNYDAAEIIGDRLLNDLSMGFTDEVIARHIEIDLIGTEITHFGIPYKVALYTQKLAEGCGKDTIVPGTPSPLTKDGLATALVMDKSGSMSGEKIRKAKRAAYIYVDTSPEQEDMVSLAAFATNAESITEPIAINRGRELLKRDVLSLSAGGSTNVGSGLTIALSHLSSCNLKDKKAVLMSDGRHNTGTYKPEVAEFEKRGWQINTVAFGRDADQDMLRWIAEQTGGHFLALDVSNIGSGYHKINVMAHNGSVYRSYNDFIRTGGKLAYNIPVEPDMKKVGFFTNWQGSRMETVLFSPNKTVINRSNISNWGRFVEGETHNCFEIYNPQCGTWQALITGYNFPPKGEQVNFHSFCHSDIFSNMLSFQPRYSRNQGVQIGVKLAQVLNGRLSPLRGARITAEIKKPSVSLNKFASDIRRRRLQPTNLLEIFREISSFTRKITLFDDGLHKDAMSGDGIYANTYNETTINGPYLVTIDCEGYTSQRMTLKRTLQESFQVGPIEQNPFTISDFLDLIRQQGGSRQIPPQERKRIQKEATKKVIEGLFDNLLKKRR